MATPRFTATTTGNKRLSALFVYDKQAAVRYVIKKLQENDGNIEITASDVNVTRQTMYNWMKRYPAIRRARDDAHHKWAEKQKRLGVRVAAS